MARRADKVSSSLDNFPLPERQPGAFFFDSKSPEYAIAELNYRRNALDHAIHTVTAERQALDFNEQSVSFCQFCGDS
jgi:hypothetical protein